MCGYIHIHGEINCRSSCLTTTRMPLLTEALFILQQPIRTETKAPMCSPVLCSPAHVHVSAFPKLQTEKR